MRSRGLFTRIALVLGLIFLYVPIISMIVFSFNNSRLVTVWDAPNSPTLKWYVALVHNEQILGAAWLSIRIALIAATGAVILGTLAGMALARFGNFRGRTLLAGMTTAPIVMPEVITGLSLLLHVRRAVPADRLAARAWGPSRSRWRTSPSAWPTSRSWCSPGSSVLMNRSKRRRWIWAPGR